MWIDHLLILDKDMSRWHIKCKRLIPNMINISLFLKKGKKGKKYPVSVYQSKQDVEI